jgi:hypothetical protein
VRDSEGRRAQTKNFQLSSTVVKSDADRPSGAQSFCRQAFGSAAAVGDSETEIPVRQSVSKWSTAATLEIVISALACRVESSGDDISLDLAVPLLRTKFFKPLGEANQFLAGEILDDYFEFLNTHAQILSCG